MYAQGEEYEAWMWLQPLCQQLVTINDVLSLKAEIFVFAENGDEKSGFRWTAFGIGKTGVHRIYRGREAFSPYGL